MDICTYPQQPTKKQLHPAIQTRLDAFAEAYSVLKNPRKIDFRPQLGMVTLELAFDNGVCLRFFVWALFLFCWGGAGVEWGSVCGYGFCVCMCPTHPPPAPTQSALLLHTHTHTYIYISTHTHDPTTPTTTTQASRSFTVAPVHASLVLHFQDQDGKLKKQSILCVRVFSP